MMTYVHIQPCYRKYIRHWPLKKVKKNEVSHHGKGRYQGRGQLKVIDMFTHLKIIFQICFTQTCKNLVGNQEQ